ncbi:uncharacterized protein lrrc53 [Danio aesculapii]|uniref:uncharacterized protein lrrc53 n=1 Tax=Danio aesculapii TaxID=1142201 RepID=UPI0024C0DC3B|nr:uncharacterized protein lrrc53 [Danio aesculapii]
MVTISQVELALLCPSSCLVCSEDVIICQKLMSIIDAPGSTKALMLTDGLIDSVGGMVFSDLSNMSVLALSNNAISSITENAFQNLTFLMTLSLDHNRISSQALNGSTFSWLHRLETLQLSNNHLKDIDGSWFQSSIALKTLQLDGNLLTSLNSTTFAHADLRNLEILDLSDNLIMNLGRESFSRLPSLRRLDLSRNNLSSAPDAFSYLSWLSTLNLDLNRWSCSCELRELASFLNSFIQAPENVLYNGQKMACVNADNPSVQTVLELTDANCVPPNSNITVEVVAKRSNTSQQYIRNVAIAIVFSFLGGVGITLGIIAIAYHKLSKKFKLMQEEPGASERITSSPETAQWNFCEGKDTLSMSHALYNSNYKSHQPWDREDSPYGSDELENHFTCHKCSSTALTGGKPNRETVLQKTTEDLQKNHMSEHLAHRRQHNGNQQHSVLQQRIKDMRLKRQAERNSKSHLAGQDFTSQRLGGPDDVSAVRIQQLALSNHFSALQRGPFRPPNQIYNEETQANHSLLKHQASETIPQPIYQTISCLHCHQTYEYRQAQSNNHDFPFTNHSQNRAQMYDAMLYRDILGYKKRDADGLDESELGFKLASQRSVTFDLTMPEERTVDRHKNQTSVQKSQRKSSAQKPHKSRVQTKKTLRVKLNLDPLRKNRVHPKSKSEDSKEDDKKRKEKLRSKKKTSKKRKEDSNGNEETLNKRHAETRVSKSVPEETEQNSTPAEGETQPSDAIFSSISEAQTPSALTVTPPDDASDAQPMSDAPLPVGESAASVDVLDQSSSSDLTSSAAPLIQEYVSSSEGSFKLRLILPEKTSNRPQTALDKKIR